MRALTIFVIELKSKVEGDRIILASVQPTPTLAETIAQVKARSAPTKARPAKAKDVLKVPKLNFDLTREYTEIEHRNLLLKNPSVAKDLVLLSAVQNTRFQLDKKGVRLRSESRMAFGCSKAEPAGPEHVMIFDEPFLFLLQRQGAAAPYFALRVDNPELLVPW